MIKRIDIITCIFFLLFAVGACTSSKNANTKEKNDDTNPELIAAKEKVPGITMERLRSGSKVYIRRCSGCHALYKPSQFTAQQWHPILIKMFEKTKVRDTTTRILITDYLFAKSK